MPCDRTPEQLRAYFASLTYEEHAANQRWALERLRRNLEARCDSQNAASSVATEPVSMLELLAEMAARRR